MVKLNEIPKNLDAIELDKDGGGNETNENSGYGKTEVEKQNLFEIKKNKTAFTRPMAGVIGLAVLAVGVPTFAILTPLGLPLALLGGALFIGAGIGNYITNPQNIETVGHKVADRIKTVGLALMVPAAIGPLCLIIGGFALLNAVRS